MNRILLPLIMITLAIGACVPVTEEPAIPNPDQPISSDDTPLPPANTPIPTDSNLVRSNVYLDLVDLLTLESYPLQFTLALSGELPTPCNQLRVDVNPPDAQNKINVNVYSVVQTDTACAQVLEPIEENVPLGSFPPGHYFLWVNGELVAEFDA